MIWDHVPALNAVMTKRRPNSNADFDSTLTECLWSKHERLEAVPSEGTGVQALLSRARLTSDVVLCPWRISTSTISPP